jgi:hypothetical protein
LTTQNILASSCEFTVGWASAQANGWGNRARAAGGELEGACHGYFYAAGIGPLAREV